ncbi:MAG: hypothetical protein ABJF01_05140 [bacterium]
MISIISSTRRVVAVGLGLILPVGCGGFHNGQAAGILAARVLFNNESLEEAAVYAVSGTQQQRIGTVMPGRTDTLVVPPIFLSGSGVFHLIARPLARSIAPDSGPIALHAGEDILITLPANQNTLIVLPPRP